MDYISERYQCSAFISTIYLNADNDLTEAHVCWLCLSRCPFHLSMVFQWLPLWP